jgi:nucleoside-diphosphate-sugar epimerase
VEDLVTPAHTPAGDAMKILITGNMGYLGSVAGAHLRHAFPQAEVLGLDLGYFSTCLTSGGLLPESRLHAQYFADVRNPPADALRGVTAVVHLAALSNDPMGQAFERLTFEINHQATVRLAERAKRAGARRFVFASSCSVYGSAEDRPRREDSAVAPLTAYARAKLLAERDLAPLADRGFAVTCLRFATAAGMSDRLRLDLVLNDFVASALATGRITILSDGSPWRPLIDVADMARGMEWGIRREVDAGGAFLLVNAGADAWNYQVRELAEAVAAAIPGTEVSVNRHASPDARSYRVDFSRYRELAPAYHPRARLAGTIQGLRRGLEALGFADANFRESSLIRLKRLRQLREAGRLNERLEWITPEPAVAPEPALLPT